MLSYPLCMIFVTIIRNFSICSIVWAPHACIVLGLFPAVGNAVDLTKEVYEHRSICFRPGIPIYSLSLARYSCTRLRSFCILSSFCSTACDTKHKVSSRPRDGVVCFFLLLLLFLLVFALLLIQSQCDRVRKTHISRHALAY